MAEKPLPPEEQNAGLANALKFVSKAARLANPVTTGLQALFEPKTVADATLDANPLSVYDKQVYHRTPHAEQLIKSGDIKFISKEPGSDIGFHVASEPRSLDYITDIQDESNLLLKLKKDINPARVIDVVSFQNPHYWKRIRKSERENPEEFKRLEKYLLSEEAKDEGYSPPIIFEYKKDRIMLNHNLVKDGLERDGKLDITYLKDLIKLVDEYDKKFRPPPGPEYGTRKSEVSTQNKREWFEALKKINKKHGYDSFSYKNTLEEQGGDSLLLTYPDQVKLGRKSGGSVMERNPHDYQPRAI
tara:strand:- start:593 stop:1498 length:906 start_codon:yes stop_codon:yes gene_type:complete